MTTGSGSETRVLQRPALLAPFSDLAAPLRRAIGAAARRDPWSAREWMVDGRFELEVTIHATRLLRSSRRRLCERVYIAAHDLTPRAYRVRVELANGRAGSDWNGPWMR